jgi:hypothetical protein
MRAGLDSDRAAFLKPDALEDQTRLVMSERLHTSSIRSAGRFVGVNAEHGVNLGMTALAFGEQAGRVQCGWSTLGPYRSPQNNKESWLIWTDLLEERGY